MTTAARPTFNPAKGGRSIRDNPTHPVTQVNVEALPGHTILKMRKTGQNTIDEIRRKNLRNELKRAELEAKQEKKVERSEETKKIVEKLFEDLDKEDEEEEEVDEEEDDESSDEESDTDELMRELEKIKRERQAENERLEKQKEMEELERLENQMKNGKNPLIEGDSFSIKRRWDDDVVFKNQAKGLDERPKKRFVNDLVRSDFHRKFINKYIK